MSPFSITTIEFGTITLDPSMWLQNVDGRCLNLIAIPSEKNPIGGLGLLLGNPFLRQVVA